MIFIKLYRFPRIFLKIKGEADTIAGLILEIKGEIPNLNEVITVIINIYYSFRR